MKADAVAKVFTQEAKTKDRNAMAKAIVANLPEVNFEHI
jgi:hypothetical protein